MTIVAPTPTQAQVTAEGIDPAGGGLLAYLGTFLLATAFYGITLHIAARYVLGDVPVKRAFTVAPLLAIVSLLLQQWGPLVVVPFTLAVAYTAIFVVYEQGHKLTLLISVIYYTVAVILGVLIANLVTLFGTAPA